MSLTRRAPPCQTLARRSQWTSGACTSHHAAARALEDDRGSWGGPEPISVALRGHRCSAVCPPFAAHAHVTQCPANARALGGLHHLHLAGVAEATAPDAHHRRVRATHSPADPVSGFLDSALTCSAMPTLLGSTLEEGFDWSATPNQGSATRCSAATLFLRGKVRNTGTNKWLLP